MAAREIVFENLILKGINKGGTLKCDDKGYYTVVLGVIGADASDGEHYVDNEKVRKVFNNSGQLARRISQGLLRGENGHPNPADYANQLAFEIRVRRMDEDKVCMHIRKVWVETGEVNGRKVGLIMGEVKPSGPYGSYLKESLDNPDENVAFSGRYYSNPTQINGKTYREIYAVGTWDYVTEPGMHGSTKYNSPQLQSASAFTIDELTAMHIVQAEAKSGNGSMTLQSGGLTAASLYGVDKVTTGKVRASMNW